MIQTLLKIVAPPGKQHEVLSVLRSLRGPTEVALGCRGCRVFQDPDDEAVLTYLVQWDTRDQFEAHVRSEQFRWLLPYVDLSVEPPEVDISAVEPIGGIEVLLSALDSKFGRNENPI